MKVAIIGTQGVPARYGGFESLVENLIGDNCPPDVEYTVFCSSADFDEKRPSYKGARLLYVPLHANGLHSILYDIFSFCRALWGYDVLLVLGVSGCLFLPVVRLLSRSRIVVNIDGLEHRRAKWGKMAKWVLRTSEAVAVRFSHLTVADNKGIQDYVAETYKRKAALISYGGDHVYRHVPRDYMDAILKRYNLRSGNYAITVCRIEPENNSQIILEAFSRSHKELVFVGNWEHSEWARHLREKYSGLPHMHLLDAIYELDVLYTLRSNAGMYIHGHSAGGTNPSLVEAMHFGMPVLAFDVVYNRETTEGKAYYFRDADELEHLLGRRDLIGGAAMHEIATRRYTWRHIADQYLATFRG